MFAFLAGDLDVLLDVCVKFQAVLDPKPISLFLLHGFCVGNVESCFAGVWIDGQGVVPIKYKGDPSQIEYQADGLLPSIWASFAVSYKGAIL